MIYYVSKSTQAFKSGYYECISVEKSLELLDTLKIIGLDTETQGLDVHSKKLLLLQLGCKEFQVVIDCTTINLNKYKDYLESDRLFIGHNLNFDLKFLYHQGVFPNNLYDTMLAEIALYLGYPAGIHHMDLKSVVNDRLNIDLDKTVRGEVISRGITDNVVVYAANDVKYLEDIRESQLKDLEEQSLLSAMKLENEFLKSNAYFEYCGAKIDREKWKAKADRDTDLLFKAKEKLDNWVVEYEGSKLKSEYKFVDVSFGRGDNIISSEREALRGAKRSPDMDVYEYGSLVGEAYEIVPSRKYTYIDAQGDLFSGFDLSPKCSINWKSTKQVIPLFEELGINCVVFDPKTKTKKKSIDKKSLKKQRHKSPIIDLYLEFKAVEIQVGTFGPKFLEILNPVTQRLHCNFHQLGTDTGRLSSSDPNLQNLPSDEYTRSCFIPEDGNAWLSADYSGQENFVMAYLANDKAMLEELLYGSGDLHSLTAKMVFPHIIPKDTPVKDIPILYHDERKMAKGYEFCFNYYGNHATIMRNFGLSKEEALRIEDAYMSGYSGLKQYQDYRVHKVMEDGFIILNKLGLRAHIYDFDDWEILKHRDPEKYKERVAASKKQSVNYPIQGTGAAIFKLAVCKLFSYVKKNDLINIVKFCIPVHDEINIECPKEMAEKMSKVLVACMNASSKYFCPTAPTPATINVGPHWIH